MKCIFEHGLSSYSDSTFRLGTALGALGYPTPDVDLDAGTETSTVNRYIAITAQVCCLRTLMEQANPSKCEWAVFVLQIPALGLIKLSFLCFLRRIFQTRAQLKTVFGIVLQGTIAVVSLWMVAFFFSWLFVCRGNFAAWWGPFLGQLQACPGAFMLLESTVISDFILDLVVVLLPLPMIYRLSLATSRKLAVSGVFLIGLLAVAASLTRLVLTFNSASTSAAIDENLLVTQQLWWIMFELGMALLANCLINLRPLMPELSGHAILNSLRSAFSSTSLSGSRPGNSDNRTFRGNDGSSTKRLASLGSGKSSTRVDTDGLELNHVPQQGGIRVQKDFHVSSTNMV